MIKTLIKSKIKHIILRFSPKYAHFKKSTKCNYSWYGNKYGGFYLCPELLNNNSIVYSFGIGEDISFDKHIIALHGCSVFGFDPTPKSIDWTKGQNLPEKFHFYQYGISDKTGLVDFFLPKNPEYISGSMVNQKNIDVNYKATVQMKALSDIMNELGHQQIDVLKMDIEGAEYDVIENILGSNIPITQLLIEFHDRFFEKGNLKSKQAIEKLKLYGYEIFAISDSFEEVSFIKLNANS